MNIQNKDQWNEAFIEACQKGAIEHVRHLCQKQYLAKGCADIHCCDEYGFYLACYHGHFDIVKYLLTSPELIEAGHTFANLHIENDRGFRMACYHGHLEVVKYLLTSPELIEAGHTLVDLHKNDERFLDDDGFLDNEAGFRWACEGGGLEVVKYFLTSPELKAAGLSFANLHAKDDYGFRWACANGRLNVVKYLLTSPELKEAGHTFANLHAKDDYGFRWACSREHWDLVHWLVMDYGIEKTPAIENILQDHPQAQEYFRVRDELKEMQELISAACGHDHITHLSNESSDERATKKAKKL